MNIYSRILSFIDPNGSECYWEELSQKKIDNRINSKLKYKINKFETKNKKIIKDIRFYTPTKISSYRAYTLLSKEKDTLEWLEKYGSTNNIFFDVGSNMGIYSIYYAKVFKTKVYSFEPSFRNLDLQTRNINLNKLEEYIKIIPNPIYSRELIENFYSSEKKIAGIAESTFGNKIKNGNSFFTLGLSLDFLLSEKIIFPPKLIKIDVDGNELNVLEGAKKFIQSGFCKSILIETRENTKKNVKKFFSDTLYSFDNSLSHKGNNEIWTKS